MAPNFRIGPCKGLSASGDDSSGKSLHIFEAVSRRGLQGSRAFVLVLAVLHLPADAQFDPNVWCRDRNPEGRFECSWLPNRVGAPSYTIPGPLESVTGVDEGGAIDLYKAGIAKYFRLCSAIYVGQGDYSANWPGRVGQPTSWDVAFWSYERQPIVFSYSVLSGSGTSTECKPSSLSTHLYRIRIVACGAGWFRDYDAATNSPFCRRELPVSACAVGNPISLGDQNKLLAETDLPLVAARSIAFVRRYSSVGHYAIGDREVRHLWEDLGAHWRHNFGGRVEPYSPSASSTGIDAAIVTRGLNTTYFRAASAALGVRVDFVPFNRDQKDRLQVERDASGQFTRAIYTSAENVVEEYQGGRPVRVTTTDGYWQALSYKQFFYSNGAPPDWKLDRITDSLGRQVSFRYLTTKDPIEGLLVSVTDVDGLTVDYEYARAEDPALGAGVYAVNLVSVTQRDRTVRRYSYGEAASFPTYGPLRATHLTGLSDELGVRIGTYRFSSSGQATSTESAGGVNKYTVSGSSFVDPRGTSHGSTTVLTAGLNRISGWYQPAGAGCGPSWSSITYDANANVSSSTDFKGSKTCYANDLGRNLEVKRIEGVTQFANCTASLDAPPVGTRVISTQWHPDWRLETRIAEPNKITTIVYNGQGATCAPSTVLVDGKPPAVVCSRSEQATTDATGALGFAAGLTGTARTWTYTYTTYGRVLTATDPNGKTTTTTYYPDDDPDMGRRGNVATLTNAANHVTRISAYNLHGQPTQIVDPNGLVTDLTYDLRMRLTSRKVGVELTGFVYDPRGLLTNVTLPDGASLTYTYDAAHRLTAIADHQGSRVDYTLDAMGNRITEKTTDPGGTLVKNIQRSIDALNRVQQVTGAN